MKQSEMSDSDCANGFCWATATPFGQTTPRIAEAVHDSRSGMTINYIHFLSLVMIRMKFANDCSLISMYLGFGTITTLVYEFDQPEEEFRRMIQLFLNKISLHFIVLYVIYTVHYILLHVFSYLFVSESCINTWNILCQVFTIFNMFVEYLRITRFHVHV